MGFYALRHQSVPLRIVMYTPLPPREQGLRILHCNQTLVEIKDLDLQSHQDRSDSLRVGLLDVSDLLGKEAVHVGQIDYMERHAYSIRTLSSDLQDPGKHRNLVVGNPLSTSAGVLSRDISSPRILRILVMLTNTESRSLRALNRSFSSR